MGYDRQKWSSLPEAARIIAATRAGCKRLKDQRLDYFKTKGAVFQLNVLAGKMRLMSQNHPQIRGWRNVLRQSKLFARPQTQAEYARHAALFVGLISPALGWGLGDLFCYLAVTHLAQQLFWLRRWWRLGMDVASKVFRVLAHVIFLLASTGALVLVAMLFLRKSNPVVAGLLNGQFESPQWLFMGGWAATMLLHLAPQRKNAEDDWIDYRENQWLANYCLFALCLFSALLMHRPTWLALPLVSFLKYGIDVAQDHENLRLRHR